MTRTRILKFWSTLVVLAAFCVAHAQPGQTGIVDYTQPKEYEIAGIKVEGVKHSDANAIRTSSGLRIGDKIRVPGPKTRKAVKRLWRLKLFTDVKLEIEKTSGDLVFLIIKAQELPRLSRHSFKGVKKVLFDDLNAELRRHLIRGTAVNEYTKNNAASIVKNYFVKRGFLDVKVDVNAITDTLFANTVRLEFDVDTKEKVKIRTISFSGNEKFSDKRLRRLMKNTRQKKRIFAGSKLIATDYQTDKDAIIAYYNKNGFRDAQIVQDSVWRENGMLMIDLGVEEGRRYYFGDIAFTGNSIYNDNQLYQILGIERGDIYDGQLLETRLRFSPDGRDISTQYLDNGYLFFQLNPLERAVALDTIDLEIVINEGRQATINKVVVEGNTRTHEHVIRRELTTKPGQKFSRSDVIRSQRNIIALGYFNQENLGIETPVNAQQGTVDLIYRVEEKPSDQLELSAGWGGAGRGVIGTLGVTFNNFSLRNMRKRETWNPLPQGDGQRLSVRAQTNGRFYQSYNLSFTEPWLGGRKPTSLSVGGYLSSYTNGLDRKNEGFRKLGINGLSVGLGTRLKWPDDFFLLNAAVNIENIVLNNWSGFSLDDGSPVLLGNYNNYNLNVTLSRNSIDDQIFPKRGSIFQVSLQLTPPYSLFDGGKDYSTLSTQDKFKFLEYHKWKIKGEWYSKLGGKFVLKSSAKMGFLGYYNRDIGITPFERFEIGGDGWQNQGGIDGKDRVSLRGYDTDNLIDNSFGGGSVYNKFTLEARYPLSTSPTTTIYVLGFLEGGNSWRKFADYNPLDLKRSFGAGLRLFLPMFGTLGFDYGFGFDKNFATPSKNLFDYGRFSLILGFEPE